jgi:hypothetical protein
MDVAGLGVGQGLEEALPQPAAGPAVEAVVDRGRQAVDRRPVLPAAAGAQDVHDAAEDTAIVHPSGARSALRQ